MSRHAPITISPITHSNIGDASSSLRGSTSWFLQGHGDVWLCICWWQSHWSRRSSSTGLPSFVVCASACAGLDGLYQVWSVVWDAFYKPSHWWRIELHQRGSQGSQRCYLWGCGVCQCCWWSCWMMFSSTELEVGVGVSTTFLYVSEV